MNILNAKCNELNMAEKEVKRLRNQIEAESKILLLILEEYKRRGLI